MNAWLATLFFTAIAALEPFHKVEESHGIVVEAQKVQGSPFENLRVSTHTKASAEKLESAVWAAHPENKENWAPGVSTREMIADRADERTFYEIVGTPIVSDRDYVMTVKRRRDPQTRVVQVSFTTVTHPRFPPKSGIVRLPRVEGECTIEPAEGGGSDISYVLFSDPGGSLPAFVARSAQRDSTVKWILDILRRAGDPRS